MTAAMQAHIAEAIFDGNELHFGHALLIENDLVAAIVPASQIPMDCQVVGNKSGYIAPGFVDLQVNGGGGVMLNDAPTVENLQIIACAHARLGTAAILPTLITDSRKKTKAAIEAAVSANSQKITGIAGLHLEGPHLSVARKGAHDPSLIRPMDDEDLQMFLDAAGKLPSLMITLAPETVRADQIAELVAAGVIVSLGHSDADYDTCLTAVEAGASCATHLFNAMSQMGNREPGLVGAALDLGVLYAGLIADTIHVHPVSMAAALRAKRGPGEIFLVTDAMAPAGTNLDGFNLNSRWVARENNKLTLNNGTLAGADLDMTTAIRVLVEQVGVSLATALRMATSVPADVIRRDDLGRLRSGMSADFVRLDSDLSLQGFWRQGQPFA